VPSNREKKRSPPPVIAPRKHVQSRWPESSTEGARLAWKPRGTRLDSDGFLGLVDTDRGGVHLPPFFNLVVKRFVPGVVSLGGGPA
jgi:hypothetical protein